MRCPPPCPKPEESGQPQATAGLEPRGLGMAACGPGEGGRVRPRRRRGGVCRPVRTRASCGLTRLHRGEARPALEQGLRWVQVDEHTRPVVASVRSQPAAQNLGEEERERKLSRHTALMGMYVHTCIWQAAET